MQVIPPAQPGLPAEGGPAWSADRSSRAATTPTANG